MPADIPNFPAWVVDAGACPVGVAVTKGVDFATFWSTCSRPDWLLWILHHAMIQGLAGFPVSRAAVVSITNTAISFSTSSYKSELLAHLTFYSNQTDPKYPPMELNDDLCDSGAFGNISDVADSVRSAVSV